MPEPCFYHPAVPSVASCVQCAMPICDECREEVAGKSVCKRCVGSIRTRLEQQMAASPPPPQSAPVGQPGYAPPLSGAQAYGAPAAVVAPQKLEPSRLVIGLVLAAVVAIIGAIVIEKIYVGLHFGLSLLYVAQGYAIGWAIHRMTGRGGPGLAVAAVGIMIGSLVLSHFVLAYDTLNAARAVGDADNSISVAQAFPIVIKHQTFMHWMLILLGLYACYRGVEQRQGA